MKSTISETNIILKGINSRLDEVEDRISYLEDKIAEHTQSEQQKQVFKK